MRKKCVLRCPICEKVFKRHETADNHAIRKNHWGDYDPEIRARKEAVIKDDSFGVLVDSTLRDSKGEMIDFPKVGGYYDKALQRRFETKKEKSDYMKQNNLMMDGSHDSKHIPVEAGDARPGKPIYFT